jgi:hypothetical protein
MPTNRIQKSFIVCIQSLVRNLQQKENFNLPTKLPQLKE